jgi:hypothetical protein
MNRTGDYHVKQSKPGSERQSMPVFFHMWKIDTKDKFIHRNKHDHIYVIYINYIHIYVCTNVIYVYIQNHDYNIGTI